MSTIDSLTLRAFHSSPEIKVRYMARVEAHRIADQLVQGETWDGNTQKGCAIGCTLHAYDHAAYELELGIPRVLARLEDGIFEGLGVAESREWPGKFLAAIPVGADLSMVWPQFAIWLLSDPQDGVLRHAKSERSRKAIKNVVALYRRWIGGDKPSAMEWRAAAAYAAYAADAAYAAAYADACADADAAAAYAADAAASLQARPRQAAMLLGLLSTSPIR